MKKGSALLIVLGMMAFMVVSAVAFSMFMRQSRLPSSFLRQRLTASQLVKAGLAGAMQRLDAGIGDNPFPGIGETGVRKVEFKKKDGTRQTIDYGNFWHNRVFLESRLAKDGSIGNDDDELDYDTVSTLTLEALAYIPPPLVNTVRFWSKRTSTAAWASLGYDAGRYAFTAVNVSDYFDINRIRADVMRDSSPENRIAIGYLFENDKHTGPGAVSPADFDAFIGKVTNDVFRTRFVSLADYNLALGSGAYGNVGFASPFWKYLENNEGNSPFYNMAPESLKQYVRPQKFVTGSWFPGLLEGDEESLYLTDEESQPLYNLDKGLDPLMKNGGDGFNEIKKHINLAERAALRDYIDEDNVPTSLALPTMERAPMLTGLQIVPLAVSPPKITADPANDVKDPSYVDNAGNTCTPVHRFWTLDSLGELKLMFGGSAVYPFKRKFATDKLGEPTSFDVQILVKAFISKEDQALTATRVTGNGSLRPVSAADWKDQPHDMNTGLFTCLSKGRITVKAALTESDALCTWSSDAITLQLGGGDMKRLYGIKYLLKKPPPNVGGPEAPDLTTVQPDPQYVDQNPLMLRDAAGNTHKATELVTDFKNLKVNFAVWIRVLDGNDTVDMVPAMIADDQIYNGMPKPGVTTDLLGEQTKEPVMPVDGPLITFNQGDFKPNVDNVTAAYGDGNGLRVYCNDPRYNWAPEDWYAPAAGGGSGVTISAQDWYDRVKGQFGGGKQDMPRDLFQFVSNMGYLQSMGEIQFLPLVRNGYSDFTENNAISGSFHQNASRYDGQAFDKRTAIGQLANHTYMWKTRFAFGNRRSIRGIESDPYDWNVYDTRGGAAVSPYGDKELMMAALANTPYDYCVASADNALKLSQDRQFTFGPGSTEALVEWEELLKVAEGIRAEFENSDNWRKDVGEVFRDLTQWDNDKGPFGADFGGGSAGDAEAEFHDVDRKFLYSYWRSCFANNQQLFLIFVRAEPSVMGGSSAGHTPSQLGARAVALVWREPVSSITDPTNTGGSTQYPHRMRILFYHQFD